jgi:hypothetical protein
MDERVEEIIQRILTFELSEIEIEELIGEVYHIGYDDGYACGCFERFE